MIAVALIASVAFVIGCVLALVEVLAPESWLYQKQDDAKTVQRRDSLGPQS